MLNLDLDKKRNVIPRWRNFETTLALGELDQSKGQINNSFNNANLFEQIADWSNNKTLSFATDLVGSSLVLGKTEEYEEVKEAADFILSSKSQSTDLQKRIAKQSIYNNDSNDIFAENTHQSDSAEIIDHSRANVKNIRQQLKIYPTNPIKLAELSREYATLGSLKKAVRAMDVAVSLAPANRFVLRSAARLFVHANDIEKAHYILTKAPSLRSDPWLLAAEIAIASKRYQTSANIKIGIQHINDANFNKFELSELTSAIATLEMKNGSKRARKLFKQALQAPTENSIAQAEWANRSMHSLNIEVREYNAPLNYEALAWSHFASKKLENAFGLGRSWILDQPFAVSPILFTGMVSTYMEDFEMGVKVNNFGLKANPENAGIRNNLAFALASNNEPNLAEVELKKIDHSNLSVQEKITTTATEGLIKFRQGFVDEGRILYKQAIELAREHKEKENLVRAVTYLAREEVNAKTGEAIQTLEAVIKESKGNQINLNDNLLFKKLDKIVKDSPETFAKRKE